MWRRVGRLGVQSPAEDGRDPWVGPSNWCCSPWHSLTGNVAGRQSQVAGDIIEEGGLLLPPDHRDQRHDEAIRLEGKLDLCGGRNPVCALVGCAVFEVEALVDPMSP